MKFWLISGKKWNTFHYNLYTMISWSATISEYVYSPAVQCDDICGVRRFCAVRWFLSMRGWYKDQKKGICPLGPPPKVPIPKPAQHQCLFVFVFTPRKIHTHGGIGFSMTQLLHPNWAEMPMKVIYLSPGLEYDENMVCEDFLNMGI